ncbi:hypothetical protein IFR05_011289 [Cadophora sp. M221]|nr:hypothetical protein IFR05_011289 [Cadophora sp. M221]
MAETQFVAPTGPPLRLFISSGNTTVVIPYLPPEILHIISRYFPPGLKDIKNMRLASREWTQFGEGLLKTECVIRPLKHDYRLLAEIVEHNPKFLERFQSTKIQIGKIDSQLVTEKIGHFVHERIGQQMALFLTNYAAYNYAHIQDNESMARLREVLLSHKKLQRIKVERYQYSVNSAMLDEMFQEKWTYKARSSSLQMNAEFLTILQLMSNISTTIPQSASPTIKHLSHESLAPSFFGHLFSYKLELRDLTLPFQHLETLHLVVLQNATNLKGLRFGFDPTLKAQLKSSNWSRPDDNNVRNAWYVALHLLDFGACATLEKLRLDVVDVRNFPDRNVKLYDANTLTVDDLLWLQQDSATSFTEWDPSRLSNWRKYDNILCTQGLNNETGRDAAWIPVDIVPYFDIQGKDPNGVHYTKPSRQARRLLDLSLGNTAGGSRGLKYEIARLKTRDSVLVELNKLHKRIQRESK